MPEQTAAWQQLIAELESDLARLDADAPGGLTSASWSPPNLGPLPDEFAPHVRDLIERQRIAIARLEESRRATGEQIATVRAAASPRIDRASVYLDVEG